MLLCLVQGCRKDPPTVLDLKIEGLTHRDQNGYAFCLTDTNDWQLLDNWGTWESSLFADRPSGPLAVAAPDTFLVLAFPNPQMDFRIVYTNQDSTTYFDMRVVNRHREVIWSRNDIADNYLYFNSGTLSPAPDSSDLVRVYYRFMRSDGTVYQGHGDLKQAALSCP